MNRSNEVQINEVAGYCPFKMHPQEPDCLPSILLGFERTKDSRSLKKALQCDRYMSEIKIPEC